MASLHLLGRAQRLAMGPLAAARVVDMGTGMVAAGSLATVAVAFSVASTAVHLAAAARAVSVLLGSVEAMVEKGPSEAEWRAVG